MKIVVRDGIVIAQHEDWQTVSGYGGGARVIVVPSGVPTAAIGEAMEVTPDIASATARHECARRISAALSTAGQLNMLAWAALVGAKTASARSDAEKADLLAYGEAVTWIEAMRATWPEIAAEGGDPFDDAAWPPLPPAAADLAARF